jgi:DNA segregation ATPase FtsK/SpoIIIE, S-DNA-T family
MASYQARQRDPLLDQGTQAMIERRGRELLGLVLLAAALGFMLLLGSYSANDPGWMVATDEPAQNMLGRFGAAISSTLIIIVGLGAWAIPAILTAWGARFVAHRGVDRVLARMVFAVIAVAVASAYATTLAPGPDWPHQGVGLGGLFGDTAMGFLLGILPLQAGFALKLLSLVMALGMIAMMLFVMGFAKEELRTIARFLLVGSIVSYNAVANLFGKGAGQGLRAAQALNERRLERRSAVVAGPSEPPVARPDGWQAPLAARRGVVMRSEPPVTEPAAWGAPDALRAEPRYGQPLDAAPVPKLGLIARIRRAVEPDPEPELVEPVLSAAMLDHDAPSDDRIKARISDAIRARARGVPAATLSTLSPLQAAVANAAARREPPVMRPRGPLPLIADTTRHVLVEDTGADDDWQMDEDFQALAQDDDADTADVAAYAPLPLRASPMIDRRPVVQQPVLRKPALSAKAVAEAQPRLRFEDQQPVYELPPLNLLSAPSTVQRHALANEALEENARMLESVLDDYGVKGEIVSVRPGPVVTMYELEPAPGLKASRVIGLADDIARSMSALSARVSTVPGRTVIGIELPNVHREKVVLREILSARDFGDSSMRLPLALGKDIGGEPIIANLAKMPHLLIAGTTGSGKSVAINTMILSLLYKLSPEECRLIMIDPKMLELSVYDGIPHLLSPVVTDPKKAVVALKWVVGEMEERYRKMSKMGVRNIDGYNGRVKEALAKNEMFRRTIQTGFDEDTGEPVFETEEFAPVAIPYIVVIVDEMADLMMVAGKEIEACIQRLAQMARASGIHLIMATQRPSVDVITGTIKANFPTRISFQVTSKIDSRTILSEQGAEQLLGMGDMLYMAGGAKITRIHGPFVSDEEVEEIVNHLKSFGPPVYMSGVVEGVDEDKEGDIDMVLGLGGDGSDDTLYDQAVAVVAKDRKCSTSYIQRKLGIGYNKAARLVEQMEENHVVTTANHVGKREILLPEH